MMVLQYIENQNDANNIAKKYKKISKNPCQFQKRLYFCNRKAKQ